MEKVIVGENVALNIRVLMDVRNVKYSDILSDGAVSSTTLNNLRHGNLSSVGVETLQRLADVLETDIPWLMTRHEFIGKEQSSLNQRRHVI
ncbi:helix-turn-helix domain-containing protein [Levilactobacillus acidifarinae]|uniref:helix-turn-helix domain-containing protein n=1 Tax=Levilactobacillus acidifarinae TaxID=267364 RepID=UPI000708E2E0|nr:helix-turn-helix transcriptional regulator [Levilactobacillus acidifarinae]GEO70501.1 hypothetical protein LAC03_24110 [Levilactobacillus acidifarinae]